MKKPYTAPCIVFDSASVAALPRDAQVLFRLTRPSPPEGAHVTGPWGWNIAPEYAEALLRSRCGKSLLGIFGLTPDEVARRLAAEAEVFAKIGRARPRRIDVAEHLLREEEE